MNSRLSNHVAHWEETSKREEIQEIVSAADAQRHKTSTAPARGSARVPFASRYWNILEISAVSFVCLSTMQAEQPTASLALTKDEEKLFTFLIRVLKHFNLKTTLRVAGGWVRDKV